MKGKRRRQQSKRERGCDNQQKIKLVFGHEELRWCSLDTAIYTFKEK